MNITRKRKKLIKQAQKEAKIRFKAQGAIGKLRYMVWKEHYTTNPGVISSIEEGIMTGHPNPLGRLPANVDKWEDRTANGLEKCIVKYCELTGHQAERVSNKGTWVGGKTWTDVIGRARVQKGKFVPSTMRDGTSDVSATKKKEINGKVYGLTVKIEVKIGRDRQSDHQKDYQAEVEAGGGIYFIAKSFEGFLEQWKQI